MDRGSWVVARRRRWMAVLLAVPAMLAGGAAPASAGPNDAYVALGDSFTAGPLIPNQQLDPLGCLRSDHNYPHLVAPGLGLPQFRDVSCSGAETDDMTQSQGVWPGPNPPQFDALDASTRVVTLGIGGNDIGFSDIVQGCASLVPWGTPCKSKYIVNGVDTVSQAINATVPKVDAVLDGIKARSPSAKIFVVAYPAILPDTGYGCWPSMPIAWLDVPYLRARHKQLNNMLKTQATANGAYYVDTYTPSIGKDACKSASTRWVEPIVPANLAAPVHPNARGMSGMASVVKTKILSVGY